MKLTFAFLFLGLVAVNLTVSAPSHELDNVDDISEKVNEDFGHHLEQALEELSENAYDSEENDNGDSDEDENEPSAVLFKRGVSENDDDDSDEDDSDEDDSEEDDSDEDDSEEDDSDEDDSEEDDDGIEFKREISRNSREVKEISRLVDNIRNQFHESLAGVLNNIV